MQELSIFDFMPEEAEKVLCNKFRIIRIGEKANGQIPKHYEVR